MKKLAMMSLGYSLAFLQSACLTQENITATALPAPTVDLTQMPAAIAGNKTLEVKFNNQAADGKTIVSTDFQYAADGVNFVSVQTLSGNPQSYVWSIPKADLSAAKIKVVAKDNRGFFTEAVSNVFSILSTAPLITIDTSRSVVNKEDTASFQGKCKAGTTIEYYGGLVPGLSSDTVSHYQSIQAPVCSNGYWSLKISEKNLNQVFSYTLKQTDIVGNSTSVAFTWTRTTQGPIITAGSMKLNSCASNANCSTSNHNLKLSIQATDSLVPIQYACFKWSLTGTVPSAPSAFTAKGNNDPCWNTVNSWSGGTLDNSQSVAFNNIDYPIGFFPGTYRVYAWFQDSIGNVSTLSSSNKGTLGTDLSSMVYIPAVPPVVGNIVVANTNTPNYPITPAQMTAAPGAPIYIKWSIQDGNKDANGNAVPLPPQAISLYYSTDEVNYTLIAANLNNSVNGNCTAVYNTPETGCYAWSGGAPSNGYFKIRVMVKNSKDMVAYASSAALNTGNMHWIAGNTDLGLGGSAAAAVLISRNNGYNGGDHHSLAVTNNGTVYFRDALRGVLKVDPISGALVTYLPIKGVYSGDGTLGTVSLRSADLITLDYQDNLLIWDYNRILKVDNSVSPPTVKTIIGAGSSQSDTLAATSLSLMNPSSSQGVLFQALPNGDIVFHSESNTQAYDKNAMLRHYHASGALKDQVTTTHFSGAGVAGNPARDLLNDSCNAKTGAVDSLHNYSIQFNPLTSEISGINGTSYVNLSSISIGCVGSVNFDPVTGLNISATVDMSNSSSNAYSDISRFNARNGDLYSVSRYDVKMTKYNPATNKWDLVIGGAGRGHCADGTLATKCPVELIDAYVTTSNQVFFVDNGSIRVINQDGTVLTLFGQSKAYGDGGLATTARFNNIGWMDITDVSGKVVIADIGENRIRSFAVGETVQTIAGQDTVASAVDGKIAAQSGVFLNSGSNTFLTIPGTDDLLLGGQSASGAYRLSVADGKWHRFLSNGGTTPWIQADGMTASQVQMPSGGARPIGMARDESSGHVLTLVTGSTNDGSNYVDSIAKVYDLTTTVQASLSGIPGIYTSSFGADGAQAASSNLPSNTVRATWDPKAKRWLLGQTSGKRIVAMKTNGTISSYTLPRSIYSFTYVSSAGATSASPQGTLYYCDRNLGHLYKFDTVTQVETALTWPSDTVQCNGSALIWNEAKSSLVFPLVQNGLQGFGEYVNP